MNLETMITENPQALVTTVNGVQVADSLQVAERFGKRHNDVMKSIEKLIHDITVAPVEDKRDFSVISTEAYFIPSTYADSMNRERKKYLLTRDGFSLLVMGFTGPAALHWKLLYIEAFNKMEQKLRKEQEDKTLEQRLADAVEQIKEDLIQEVKTYIAVDPPKIEPTAKALPEFKEDTKGTRRLYAMYGNEAALPNLLTVYDVRDFLGIGQRQAYELVRSEGFPKTKVGSCYRIDKTEFLNWFRGTR